jgi:hypothetical protein
MQTENSRRDLRLRECLAQIIEKNNITHISLVDFNNPMFNNMNIGDVKDAIEAYVNKSNCKYTMQFARFLKNDEEFDPFLEGFKKQDSKWLPMKDLIYNDLEFNTQRSNQTFMVWSSVEIWHLIVYRFTSEEVIYGISTTICREPQRYFHLHRGNLLEIVLNMEEQESISLNHRKTCNGCILSRQAAYMRSLSKQALPEKELPLHEFLIKIVNKHTF